jgi:hypothetical protein
MKAFEVWLRVELFESIPQALQRGPVFVSKIEPGRVKDRDTGVNEVIVRQRLRRFAEENKRLRIKYAGQDRTNVLSLEHPNRIDFYFVAGLVAIVAVSVFWLMRRK